MAEEKCPNCGAEYEGGGTFCINCGAKREETAAVPEADVPQTETPPSEKPESEPTPPGKSAESAEEARAPAAESPAASVEKEPNPERPPADEKPPPAGPKPAAASLSGDGVLDRLDEALEAETPPVEPKKKGKKGCCIAAVIGGVALALAVACLGGLYFTGTLEKWGGDGYTHDFAAVTDADFTVWQRGTDTTVKPEKGMLKVRNALVGVNYDPGANYTATCAIFVQSVDNDLGWAGLVVRVNPKGGDRYTFEIVPEKKTARIRKITGKAKPLVLATSDVPALTIGKPFTVKATASGNDLTMTLNGTVVGEATDIGLLHGPMGFEVRHATAYFDDLSITPE